MPTPISDQTIELTVDALPITDAIQIVRDLCERKPTVTSLVFGADIQAKLRRMVTVRVDNLGGGRARAYIEPSEYLWGIVHVLEAMPDEPPAAGSEGQQPEVKP